MAICSARAPGVSAAGGGRRVKGSAGAAVVVVVGAVVGVVVVVGRGLDGGGRGGLTAASGPSSAPQPAPTRRAAARASAGARRRSTAPEARSRVVATIRGCRSWRSWWRRPTPSWRPMRSGRRGLPRSARRRWRTGRCGWSLTWTSGRGAGAVGGPGRRHRPGRRPRRLAGVGPAPAGGPAPRRAAGLGRAGLTRPDDVVISLDPGRAFGSGSHPSTLLALAAMEDLVTPPPGCSTSGAGAGCWPWPPPSWARTAVVAVDVDPAAVGATRQNASSTASRTASRCRRRRWPGSPTGSTSSWPTSGSGC